MPQRHRYFFNLFFPAKSHRDGYATKHSCTIATINIMISKRISAIDKKIEFVNMVKLQPPESLSRPQETDLTSQFDHATAVAMHGGNLEFSSALLTTIDLFRRYPVRTLRSACSHSLVSIRRSVKGGCTLEFTEFFRQYCKTKPSRTASRQDPTFWPRSLFQ